MTNQSRDLGAVSRQDGRIGLRYERHLPHPVEKVWRALTESEHLQHWFPADLVGERRPGGGLDVRFWPAHVEAYAIDEPVLPGEIRVWDPPKVFEWTWSTDVLRWELEETGDGTLLTFTTWLGDGESGLVNTAAGYHVCLDYLETLLDTGSTPPLVGVDVAPVEARYTEAVGAGDAVGGP